MKKRLATGALGAFLLLGLCPSPASSATSGRVLAAPRVHLGSASQGGDVYKYADGGIQFAVPAGWTTKADKDGVKLASKNGIAQIGVIALAIDSKMSAEDRASLFDTLVEKSKGADSKVSDLLDVKKMAGLDVAIRSFETKTSDATVQGLYILLSGDKTVFIVMAAAKVAGDPVDKDMEGFLDSVKKIQ